MKKYILYRPALLVLNLLLYITVQGQIVTKELKVGDHCPDFEFSSIINYPTETAHLSDFKGKLVVLDFWATWCGPCVYALPKLDSLQEKFKDKIVILPITSESLEVASRFIKKSNKIKSLRLPFVTANKQLNDYFPHSLIPHEVWIDEAGKVIAITGGEEVTAKTINEYLTSKQVPSRIKKDIMQENYQKLLLMGGYGPEHVYDLNLIKQYSIITDWVEGGGSSSSIVADFADSLIVFCMRNLPISALYVQAFAQTRGFLETNPRFSLQQPSRLIIESKDSSLISMESPKVKIKNKIGKYFCYETLANRADSLIINDRIVSDLNKYFLARCGISGYLEKRKVKCWILKKSGSKNSIKSKGGNSERYYGPNNDAVFFRNMSFRKFVYDLTTYYFSSQKYPLIDETQYTDNIDLDIRVNLIDPVSVGHALEKYGFHIALEERLVDMIVIKDVAK
jgi:thiol-disulfide isomerase/thioredoxin